MSSTSYSVLTTLLLKKKALHFAFVFYYYRYLGELVENS